MTRQEYEKTRNDAIEAARNLINEGKADEAQAKMDEVKELDARYSEQITMEANLNALAGNQIAVGDMSNVKSVAAPMQQSPVAEVMDTEEGTVMTAEEQRTQYLESEAYANAWTKAMMKDMGGTMTSAEKKAFQMVNGTLEIKTGMQVAIPTTIVGIIMQDIEHMHPILADMQTLHVPGNITLLVEGASSDAKWVDEDEDTPEGSEALGTVELTGCELARDIDIKWKLQKMAIPAFQTYIAHQMAVRIGAAYAYGVIYGKGIVDGKKLEPTGIFTGIDSSQKVNGDPSYDTMCEMRALIASGYKPSIYANNNTIWSKLAKIKDATGNPIFIADPSRGGVNMILGCEVKEESGLLDGDIIMADMFRTYTANVNEEMSVLTDIVTRERATTYSAYMIVDGAITAKKGASVMQKAAAPTPDTSKTYTEDELRGMTMQELRDLATALSIQLTKTKKDEMIEEIITGQA